MSEAITPDASEPNDHGYRSFRLGSFEFSRDAYFAHIEWPKGHHSLSIDAFLRALMRDVAWGFFYGTVNFDAVFGTVNHYGTVDLFAGRFNESFRKSGRAHSETHPAADVMATFRAVLDDWTNVRAEVRGHFEALVLRGDAPLLGSE